MNRRPSVRFKTSTIVALAVGGSILVGGMMSNASTDSIHVDGQQHILVTSTSTSIPFP